MFKLFAKISSRWQNSLLAGNSLIFGSATLHKGILLSVQRYMIIVLNKKYKLIQVMGTLYRYISFTALNCSYLPISMKNSIVILPCIFELTVLDETCGLSYCKQHCSFPGEPCGSVVECLLWVQALSACIPAFCL